MFAKLATWEDARAILDDILPEAEEAIDEMKFYAEQYPSQNNNPEGLSGLLAHLNVSVMKLGEIQPVLERVKNWTDKRWEMEKGLAAVRITRGGKAMNYADKAKYEELDGTDMLPAVVDSSAMHMRVQHARSSARDTTEAIRSRISQIKGSIRSS